LTHVSAADPVDQSPTQEPTSSEVPDSQDAETDTQEEVQSDLDPDYASAKEQGSALVEQGQLTQAREHYQ